MAYTPIPNPLPITDNSGSLTVDTTQLPVALGANGGLKIEGVASGTAIPVSGTFFQATQPVSLATNTPDVTDRAARLLGHVTVDSAPTTAVTNAGLTNLDVALSTRLKPADTLAGVTTVAAVTAITNALPAGTNQLGAVSLGNSTGKTNVLKTGSLASSATTADQVILTYTVTTGKTFYLEYLSLNVRLTTFAATATYFGTASLENPSGTKLYTDILAGSGVLAEPILLYFAEPVPIASATVIRLVCTPSAVTAFTWQGNFGGYEK